MDAEAVDLGLDIDVRWIDRPPESRDLFLLDLQRAGQKLEARRTARPWHRAADHIDADHDVHAFAGAVEGNRIDASAIDQLPALDLRSGNDAWNGDRGRDGLLHIAGRHLDLAMAEKVGGDDLEGNDRVLDAPGDGGRQGEADQMEAVEQGAASGLKLISRKMLPLSGASTRRAADTRLPSTASAWARMVRASRPEA